MKPRPPDDDLQARRQEIARVETQLKANRTKLEKDFPDFATLAMPRPLKSQEIQKLLAADEALTFILTGIEESYVFALSRETLDWGTIPVGAEALSRKVAAFRRATAG